MFLEKSAACKYLMTRQKRELAKVAVTLLSQSQINVQDMAVYNLGHWNACSDIFTLNEALVLEKKNHFLALIEEMV
jgi:hypothetical protein